MKLYYKKYAEFPVEIPETSIIIRETDDSQLKSMFSNYPVPFCLEVDGINRININADGYFDFSKSIIDIGADLGEYCWLTNFSHAYAFEPNRESVFALCANALLHDAVDKVTIYQEFLSDRETEIPFNGFDSLDTDEYTPTIRTKTLDSFNLTANIGCIKIDVEQHEYEVLCGARETIKSNNYPPIIFECVKPGMFGMTQERYDNTHNILKDMGYSILESWIDLNTHLAIHNK